MLTHTPNFLAGCSARAMPVLRISPIPLCGVLPFKKLRLGTLAFLKLKGAGFQTPSMSTNSGTVGCTQQSERSIEKEEVVESDLGIEAIRVDPSRLDSMTVKDLRTLTRSLGITTRGTKKDLVSALKCFSLGVENGNDIPSAINPVQHKNVPSKRKAKTSSLEDDVQVPTTDLEVPKNKQKKVRRKQKSVETAVVEDGSTTLMSQHELAVETEEVVDKEQSRMAKKVSSRAQGEQRVVDQVGLVLNSSEPWTVLAHKKPQSGWIPYNPGTMRPPPLTRDTKFVKLMSWNVNGLRALLKLESFSALQLAQREDFDVLCLQETKIQDKDVEVIKEQLIDGYNNSFWTCSVSKLGYSGTAIISRIKPISVKYGLGIPDHDSEGRLVTVEFDAFYLISAYVPNSGEGLKRLSYRVKEWDPSLSNYMKELEKSKPVILTGDLNCAHQEIDTFDPAGNRRSAGFTIEERESFEMNFLAKGFVDTFRKQHPGVVAYTYWGYRHGLRKSNKGWRLDYFLVSESISDKVHDSYILPDITGSDHCPLGLILKV